MKLRLLKGGVPGRVYEISGTWLSMGRETDNDVVIDEAGASRYHCRLMRLDRDTWILQDLHSMNGVYLNGNRVDGEVRIQPGDVISLQDWQFLFFDEAPAVQKAAPVAKPAAPKAAPVGISPSCRGIPEPPSGVIPPRPLPGEIPVQSDSGIAAAAMLVFKILLLVGTLGFCLYMGWALLQEYRSRKVGYAENTPQTTAAEPEDDSTMLSGTELGELLAVPEEAVEEKAPVPGVTGGGKSSELVDYLPAESEPAGAEVLLDGKPVGVTPCILRKIPGGNHVLTLKKEGYETLTRRIFVPDTLSSKPYRLVLKAGSVSIVTEPAGAWVVHGRRFLGVTPLAVSGLKPGKYDFQIQGPGCEPSVHTVELEAGKSSELKLQLKSVLGKLEITTRPPGCEVLLNDVYLGTTESGGKGKLSAALEVPGVMNGAAVLKVRHPSGIFRSGNIVIPRGGLEKRTVSLWIPTHRITLKDGEKTAGMLIQENQKNMVLELITGLQQQFPKNTIAEIREIAVEDMKGIMEKERAEVRAVVPLLGGKSEIDSGMLWKYLAARGVQAFNKQYRGHNICVAGKIIAVLKENGMNAVILEGNVKCVFAPGVPAAVYEEPAAGKEAIRVQGICGGADRDATIISINNCEAAVN